MEEKRHLISVLKKVKVALVKRNVIVLKDLSNMTIHSASVNQKDVYVLIAVLIYSLSKIYERSNYKEYKSWKFFDKDCLRFIDKAISLLEKEDETSFRSLIKQFFGVVGRLDSRFKKHVQYVFFKSKIAKGSRIHEHGISLGRVAEVLGVSQFDLQTYVGSSGIAEVKVSGVGVLKRLEVCRGLFK